VSKADPIPDDVVQVADLDGCDHFILVADFLGDAVPLHAYRSLVDAMIQAAVLDREWCRAQSPSEFFGVLLWCFKDHNLVHNITLIDDQWVRTDGRSEFSREGAAVWAETYPRKQPPGFLF